MTDHARAVEKRKAVAMGRRLGMSPAARERLNAHNAECTWVGRCRRCGVTVKGKLGALAHECQGVGDGADTASTAAR